VLESYVTPIGSLQTLMFCKTFISDARTLETVSLKKFTTNKAVPSLEIAKLRAASPVFTLLIVFLATKSQA
jgi:hypothetical protein